MDVGLSPGGVFSNEPSPEPTATGRGTMDEVKDFLERLRKEMFVRHVEEIAPIISRGGVAVVVFEPSQAAKAALRVRLRLDW